MRVFEAVHLVAPFLTTPDLLALSAAARWLQGYRGAARELRVGSPPDGMGSGHWTSLANLMANLKGLNILQVAHAQSVFGLTKCLGLQLTASLGVLDLSHCKLWRQDEERLVDALARRALPSVRRLVLADTAIGDRAIRAVAKALGAGACPNLEYLNLMDNNLHSAGLELGAAISSGAVPLLKCLVLSGNVLGRQGVGMLLRGLASRGKHGRCPLEELDLVETDLSVEGSEALSRGLLEAGRQGGPLAGLRSLRLNGNRLGNRGLEVLAAALRGGALPLCEALYLGANYISNGGLTALLEACEAGALPQLTSLNLSFNFLDAQALQGLIDAVQRGRGLLNLKHVDVYMNEVKVNEKGALLGEARTRAPNLQCFM